MLFGGAFTLAAGAASAAGKVAANAIVSGARAVGKAALIAKEKAISETKELVRKGITSGAGKFADGVVNIKAKASRIASKVSQTFKKARENFSGKPVANTTAPCPHCNPKTDKDADGLFIGDECTAIPRKKKKPTDEDIKSAKEKGYKSTSKCCEKLRREGKLDPPDRTIYYVNGTNTTQEAHCKTLEAISESTCANVVGIYNATDGVMNDLLEAGEDRRLIKLAGSGKPTETGDGRNPAVDSMSSLIIREVSAGNKPEIWAHSQGGAITSLALYDAKKYLKVDGMKEKPLDGIQVKSFGSAAPKWPDGPNYEHYVDVNDLVPMSLGLGGDQKDDQTNGGRSAKVIRFAGNPMTGNFKENPSEKKWIPGIASHDIDANYLKMEYNKNKECRCPRYLEESE